MFNGHKHLSYKKNNKKTDNFLKKYIFDRKKGKVFRSDSEQDPDPLFHETKKFKTKKNIMILHSSPFPPPQKKMLIVRPE